MNIAEKIELKRKDFEFTKGQFCKYLGIHSSTYTRILKNKISTTTLVSICKILAWPLEDEKDKKLIFVKSKLRITSLISIPLAWIIYLNVKEKDKFRLRLYSDKITIEKSIDNEGPESNLIDEVEKLIYFHPNAEGRISPRILIPLKWRRRLELKEEDIFTISIYNDKITLKKKNR
ncbi:AbrB/MazE/SpoVT family DNA-binding domain-containing protein [Clostridioides difficile]|nr:AbrB/MazE/SpoVT family DNA-binding domain-containing protein [Clostridioides difficile]MDI3004350.1 AbrB/MazE/SpoVT family DNA-binding domain-containing protein [Clostridioides difficile]